MMEVGYMDESGFSLTLPPTYAWGRRGEAKGVPRAWGSRGRVNVVGHLVRGQEGERLYFALWRGRCGGRRCGGTWTGWPKV